MSDPATLADVLSHRAFALLRAVGAGRAEMTCSSEPDLFVDGLACCDQSTAHHLAHDGLIEPVEVVSLGCLIRARLTTRGVKVLEARAVSPVAA